ncbi:MAG: hypothetical protein QN131_00140 [Armatimonadota bacterium]|nr:hypothetical protein [Armatimonadota bacterium]MDR7548334.1 hypothetical protein [Armatimonadota bacterium]
MIVIAAMLALQVTAWAFLSRMNVEQRLAGGSVRQFAALFAADAGLQKALWTLEESPPEASGGGPLDSGLQEALETGAFAVETVESLPDGLIAIVVRGEAGGAVRRIRALLRVGPEVFAYGVYGHSAVVFDGQARTYVVPCRANGACRQGGDLAAGRIIWFGNSWVALNDFRGRWLSLREGPISDRYLLGAAVALDPSLSLLDLVLAGDAQLLSGPEQAPVDLEELRRRVQGLGVRRLRIRGPFQMPVADMRYLKALADRNDANALTNSAAGAPWDDRLGTRAGSRYTEDEFEAVLDYLKDHPTRVLRGIVFVDGDVELEHRTSLTIVDGALIVDGGIEIQTGARLEVRHGPGTRTLPGIVAWQGGGLHIRREGLAIIDGLVLSDKDVNIEGGTLDVAGAVAAKNFLNTDGTAVVRYNSAVLSSVGIRRVGRGFAELLSWQELR